MKALILVDIQNDFLPGGALEAPKGDEIFPQVNELQKHFDLVVATQDWHPENHKSFAANHEGKQPGDVIELNGLEQVLWPVHCVQGSKGAEFSPQLDTTHIDKIIPKGTDPEIDSYSSFYDNGHLKSTGLTDYLREKGVDEVYIAGLATDVCVKFTAIDAAKEGFKTYVIIDATSGVELSPGDVEKAKEEMQNAGVKLVKHSELSFASA